MRIAIDLDEVLGEFLGEFLKWYNPQHGTTWSLDDMTDYHWPNVMGNTTEEAIRDVHEFYETENFSNMPLVAGAKEGITKLAEEHELYLVTGRPHALEAITRSWLDRNFPGVFQTVRFTNMYPKDGSPTLTKGEVCKQLGCEVILDDDTRHVSSLLEHGVRLVVMNKPWNGHHRLPPQIKRVEGWGEVTSVVEQLIRA